MMVDDVDVCRISATLISTPKILVVGAKANNLFSINQNIFGTGDIWC